jgi:hypothetical protein
MCSSVYSQEIYLKLARTPRCINILIPMEMKIILSVMELGNGNRILVSIKSLKAFLMMLP